MNSGSVRPRIRPMTDADYRELLSPSLDLLCETLGRIEVAEAIRCDPKTITNARYEKASLQAPNLFNLLLLDPTALDSLLAHYGLQATAIGEEPGDPDLYFDDAATEAAEYLTRWTKARTGGAKLCHQGRAALKAIAKRAKGAMGRAVRA